MWSLIKAAVLLAVVAALVFLLPFGGRTLAARWRAADGVSDFAARTWAEMRGVPAPRPQHQPRSRGQARAEAPRGEADPGDAPAEGHTEADRRALDKLLGDHLAGAPKR